MLQTMKLWVFSSVVSGAVGTKFFFKLCVEFSSSRADDMAAGTAWRPTQMIVNLFWGKRLNNLNKIATIFVSFPLETFFSDFSLLAIVTVSIQLCFNLNGFAHAKCFIALIVYVLKLLNIHPNTKKKNLFRLSYWFFMTLKRWKNSPECCMKKKISLWAAQRGKGLFN